MEASAVHQRRPLPVALASLHAGTNTPLVAITSAARRIATTGIVVPGPATLPAELLALRHGLLWRPAPAKTAGGKARKVPYYVGGGVRKGPLNGAEDRAGWVTVADAIKAAQRSNAGVGVAICDDDEAITCIDLDNCIAPNGAFNGNAQQRAVLDAAEHAGAFVELSPSGNGLHVWGAPRTGPTARLSCRGWRFSPPPASSPSQASDGARI